MATSGSNSTNFVTKYYLIIEWSAVANSSKTSYTVTANVYLSSAGSSYPIYSSASKYGTITIDGTDYSFSFSAALNGNTGYRKLIGSASKSGISPGTYITVSASAGVNITFKPGGYIGTVSVSSYGTLDTLDIAAPTFTASVSSKTLNTFVIKWSANANCSSVMYSLDGGGSWDYASGQSGTSGSFTISGLKPQTTYSVVTCGYGSASSKWGYGTIGNVMTVNRSYLTISSIPTSIEFTKDSANSKEYIKSGSFVFDITNESNTAMYYYVRNKAGTSIKSGSIASSATSLTVSFTSAQMLSFVNGTEFCIQIDLYCGGKTSTSEVDYVSTLYHIYESIKNYTLPVIQAIYGIPGNKIINNSYTSAYIKAICTFNSLVISHSNLIRFDALLYDITSGTKNPIDLYDDEIIISGNVDAKANTIAFEIYANVPYTATRLQCEISDGVNTVIGQFTIQAYSPNSNYKKAQFSKTKTQCVEFIEGLPFLAYPGGYLGGSEFVESEASSNNQFNKNQFKVNELVEY